MTSRRLFINRVPYRRAMLCVLSVITAVLCLGPKNREVSPAVAQTAASVASSYSANSPHWSHINILDFGTNVRALQDGAIRREGYEWYARHVDSMFINMDTFTHYYDANMKATAIKALNPSMKVFGEDLDQYMCQHRGCNSAREPNTAVENLPEDYYLHFSTDTHIDFYGYDGVTFEGDIDIPGCPASEQVTSACRIQFWEYNHNKSWITNMKSAGWRDWFAGHLIDEMTVNGGQENPTDTILLDGHGPGFTLMMGVGYLNKITSGGNIREYNDRAPTLAEWVYYPDRKVYGYSYDDLDREFNTDVSNWLVYLRTRLATVGKTVRINIGDNITDPLSFEQALAANSIVTEHMNKPTNYVFGVNYYQKTIQNLGQITANGGTVDFLGTLCQITPSALVETFPSFTAGNYGSPIDRYRMWTLADYYIMKESPTDAGLVYFNPTLCLGATTTPAQDLDAQWLAAYEINVGLPVADPVLLQQGSMSCAADGYGVFSRQYSNALILVRARGGSQCNDFGDATAVTVPLETPMSMLNPDGTLSESMTSVSIRNAEAVILMTPPDNTPPGRVLDLRAAT